jgi:hypothetical protein
MKHKRNHRGRMFWRGRGFWAVVAVLALPLLLGAWKGAAGQGINPSHVEHIQDGKTKKPEILTWFGDPQEVKRSPEGVVYIYQSFRPKQGLPRKETREIKQPANTPFELEENLKIKPKKAGPNKELDSSLIIRFKPDGETVQSHQYQKF